MITQKELDASANFNLAIVDYAVNKFYDKHAIGKSAELKTKAILRFVAIQHLDKLFSEFFRQFAERASNDENFGVHDPGAFITTFKLFFYENMEQLWSLPFDSEDR